MHPAPPSPRITALATLLAAVVGILAGPESHSRPQAPAAPSAPGPAPAAAPTPAPAAAPTPAPVDSGRTLHYRLAAPADTATNAPAIVEWFLTTGPVERHAGRDLRWFEFRAARTDRPAVQAWFLAPGYPPARPDLARSEVVRYLVREGSGPVVEYRDRLTDRALLPSVVGWRHLLPRTGTGSGSGTETGPDLDPAHPPAETVYLGNSYRLVHAGRVSPAAPPAPDRVRRLRSDFVVGLPSNQRQKDETRRFDGSDYEYVRLTRDDYRTLVDAGFNALRVDRGQLPFVEDLDTFHWGLGPADIPFPEGLYRSTYLGPALFLDEPGVGTRDHVLRPRLAREPDFRRSITVEDALDAFRGHFAEVLAKGAPVQFRGLLDAEPGARRGTFDARQENLFSWETLVATAGHQLSQDPAVPAALVFEPPGRLGSRRTLPELNMTYGCQLPIDEPAQLTRILYAFLRGAARATGKQWGTSVYGAVDRADAPGFFTHAYDLGATRFFCWDNYQLACVPFSECLALARHLKAHADSHPRGDLDRLRSAAEVLILLPPGYNLGHVHLGKGSLWGLPELHLERRNPDGVTYRRVMAAVFAEIERCIRQGVAFDLLWDLPGMAPAGYRERIRVRTDARVEVETGGSKSVEDGPRAVPRPPGVPPRLEVRVGALTRPLPVDVEAVARVEETTARVFYTTGADARGVHHNAVVFWELLGPDDPDYRHLTPADHRPNVVTRGGMHEVRTTFRIERAGRYRLRAAVCDLAGRTTVSWTDLTVPAE